MPRSARKLEERAPAAELQRQQTALDGPEGPAAWYDLLPVPVMILNRQRQVVYANQALRALAVGSGKLTGLRPGELLACEHALAASAGCGTIAPCQTCGAFEAILASLDDQGAERDCHLLRTGSAGVEAVDLRVSSAPFPWQGETYLLITARDISDEKRRQVLERLFFHDLMNTAGALTTMVDLLAYGVLELDEVRQDLLDSTAVLVNEVQSHRQLTAAEQQRLEPELEPIDLHQLTGELLNVYRHHPVARERQLGIIPGSPELRVTTDPALLSRVLGNLLKNALEATPAGERVCLGWQVTDGHVAIAVHNPGVIPAEILTNLFRRSFSTKGQGRGLGTYSVRLLTERYLGGSVAVDSTTEAGTTFTIRLPLGSA